MYTWIVFHYNVATEITHLAKNTNFKLEFRAHLFSWIHYECKPNIQTNFFVKMNLNWFCSYFLLQKMKPKQERKPNYYTHGKYKGISRFMSVFVGEYWSFLGIKAATDSGASGMRCLTSKSTTRISASYCWCFERPCLYLAGWLVACSVLLFHRQQTHINQVPCWHKQFGYFRSLFSLNASTNVPGPSGKCFSKREQLLGVSRRCLLVHSWFTGRRNIADYNGFGCCRHNNAMQMIAAVIAVDAIGIWVMMMVMMMCGG